MNKINQKREIDIMKKPSTKQMEILRLSQENYIKYRPWLPKWKIVVDGVPISMSTLKSMINERLIEIARTDYSAEGYGEKIESHYYLSTRKGCGIYKKYS